MDQSSSKSKIDNTQKIFELLATNSSYGVCSNVCGLPPAYTVLEAVRPGRGKVLHYSQYVHPDGSESVSFAGWPLAQASEALTSG